MAAYDRACLVSLAECLPVEAIDDAPRLLESLLKKVDPFLHALMMLPEEEEELTDSARDILDKKFAQADSRSEYTIEELEKEFGL